MNTPNNKRKKESINMIEKAFVELIQKKDIDKISVSEICKLCNLNRTTFYSNYSDIYELADKIRENIEKQVKEAYKFDNIKELAIIDYYKLFKIIYDNQILIKTYFKLGYDKIDISTFAFNEELASEQFENKHIKYHMEFFRAGITALIKSWLDNGCKEKPEEMVEIIEEEYKGRESRWAEPPANA